MPMYVLKPVVQQPLAWHNDRSHGDDRFGPAGTDIMVHLPSSTNRWPETNQMLVRT